MLFQIRHAKRQDADLLTDLLISSFYTPFDGVTRWLYPLLYFGIREDLKGRLRSQKPYYSCLVATKSNYVSASFHAQQHYADDSCGSELIVGTVEVALKQTYPWQLQPTNSLYISNLAVRTPYRRQGVAKALLEHCEQMAQSWCFQTVYLHVLETNVKARTLYRKLGYRHHAVDSEFSSWLFGQPERLLLRKDLSS